MLLRRPYAVRCNSTLPVHVERSLPRKAAAVAQIGIFHDEEVREAVADRIIDVREFAPKQAA